MKQGQTSRRKVSAKIGEKVLSKASRFFRGATDDMLSEAIQNSRRAGSTTVTMRLLRDAAGAPDALQVSDDGGGLAADKAQVLLTFGGSDNDAALDVREDSAGIGFFSMSAHDVEVRSRDWSMTVPSAAFTGGAEATVTEGLPDVAGLTVTLHGIAATPDVGNLVSGALPIEVARHSGLDLVLEGFGDVDGRHASEDFLAVRTKATGGLANHATATAHGVTVRVLRHREGRSRGQNAANFFGKVIALPKSGPIKAKCHEDCPVGTRDGAGRLWSTAMEVSVLIDVHDTSCLKLVLPARNEVYDDAGVALVNALIERLTTEVLAGGGVAVDAALAGANGVSAANAFRETAKRLGRPIPAPSLRVSALGRHGGDALTGPDGVTTLSGRTIPVAEVVKADSSSYLDLLAELAEGEMPMMFDAGAVSRAFGDAACRSLTAIRVVARVGDEEHVAEVDLTGCGAQAGFDAALSDEDFEPQGLVDALGLQFVVDGEPVVTLSTTAVPFTEEGCESTEMGFLLTADAEVSFVVGEMLDGFSWHSDDHESDSYDTQRDAVTEFYTTMMMNALGCGSQGLACAVADAVRDKAWGMAPAGDADEEVIEFRVRVVVRRRGCPTVDVDVVTDEVAELPAAA